MRTGEASGVQIAFLVFAVALLAVPLSDYAIRHFGSAPDEAALIGRLMPFAIGAIVLLGFPGLRTLALNELARPIPTGRRQEVACVALAKAIVLFAMFGAMALWFWWLGGPDLVAHALKGDSQEVARAKALSVPGLLHTLAAATVVPVMEELVYRGLLYKAWERQWGALASAMLTSLLFASYHSNFFAAFTSAIVFVCVVRRTGTLWASIAVHSCSNLVLWYPILGRFMLPGADHPSGELSAWTLHLTCLAFAAVALPAYVYLAVRKPYVVQA